MRDTKPLYLAIILVFIFTLIYNILFTITLNMIPNMLFKNEFFMFEYSHLRNNIILSTDKSPNFLNWIMLLAFVGLFISLLIRKHINKTLRPYKL
jgi:Na+/H+ antiporter NhaC